MSCIPIIIVCKLLSSSSLYCSHHLQLKQHHPHPHLLHYFYIIIMFIIICVCIVLLVFILKFSFFFFRFLLPSMLQQSLARCICVSFKKDFYNYLKNATTIKWQFFVAIVVIAVAVIVVAVYVSTACCMYYILP